MLNSYAVPFEEDAKSPDIWSTPDCLCFKLGVETPRACAHSAMGFLTRYLDHNYHENMYAMFKKVGALPKPPVPDLHPQARFPGAASARGGFRRSTPRKRSSGGKERSLGFPGPGVPGPDAP